MIDLDAYRARLVDRRRQAFSETGNAALGIDMALAILDEMRGEALSAADAPALPAMNHTPTTQAMRKAAWPKSGSLRAEIVGHLGRFPMTDDGLEHLTGRTHQSVSAARNGLVADGWVEKASHENGAPVERRTRSGNPAQVWRLTPAAQARLAQDARRDALR